jgi:hypothetical protein
VAAQVELVAAQVALVAAQVELVVALVASQVELVAAQVGLVAAQVELVAAQVELVAAQVELVVALVVELVLQMECLGVAAWHTRQKRSLTHRSLLFHRCHRRAHRLHALRLRRHNPLFCLISTRTFFCSFPGMSFCLSQSPELSCLILFLSIKSGNRSLWVESRMR